MTKDELLEGLRCLEIDSTRRVGTCGWLMAGTTEEFRTTEHCMIPGHADDHKMHPSGKL